MNGMGTEAYIWICTKGHRSAHTEAEIRDLLVHPRCPIKGEDGRACWSLLERPVRKLQDVEAT